jgi:hypothetical protein
MVEKNICDKDKIRYDLKNEFEYKIKIWLKKYNFVQIW